MLSRVAFWGVIKALLSVINICYPPPPPSFSSPLINEDLPAGQQLVFTLNNRFFRHQVCYILLPARPGRQAERVIGLYKYKDIGHTVPATLQLLSADPNEKPCTDNFGSFRWRPAITSFSSSCKGGHDLLSRYYRKAWIGRARVLYRKTIWQCPFK